MRALALALLLIGVTRLQAQPRAVVTDLGQGASGRILAAALAQPHRLIEPAATQFILARHEQERATLVVLGRSASIRGNVEGDVIVVDGDLFVSPGARIAGRAVAIGGGVYPSALAVVEKGSEAFRDNTFTITPVPEGYQLAYRSLREHASPPLMFPLVYGLRMPDYDRVNGVSIPFGPALSFANGRGEADFLAAYRSDLGKVDPSVDASLQLTRRLRIRAAGGRGTFSNDEWIWSDLVNSFAAVAFGTDTRNYYRADRGELTVHRLWETTRTRIEPFIGARAERAWSVGPFPGEGRGPWSVWGRTDTLGMWRLNPIIQDGGIASLLVGSTLQWDNEDLRFGVRSTGEVVGRAPGDQRFAQLTSDFNLSFPTFGEQEYALDVHWMTTFGDAPPPQRFAWLGGSGTLPFQDLLEMGGDELLLVDQRYSIPLLNVRLGMFGNPTLLLRHRLGGAGLGKLPDLEHVIGAGVMVVFIRGEVQLDASTGDVRFSTGFSFSR